MSPIVLRAMKMPKKKSLNASRLFVNILGF
jgi:hypothetical protein